MADKYIVVDEFEVKNRKIIVLDKDRSFKDFNTSKINIDGKSYEYGLTHDRRWISVKTDMKLVGKELIFVQ